MKKALILVVILLMLFLILCSFSFGEPSSTRGESIKGNPLRSACILPFEELLRR